MGRVGVGRARRFRPVVVPASVSVVLFLLGRSAAGVLLVIVASAALVAVLAGLDVDGWVARQAVRIANVVSATLAWTLWSVLVIPTWAVHAVTRRSTLDVTDPSGRGWSPSSSSSSRPSATCAVEPAPQRPASRGHRVVLAVGVIAIVLLLDVGLGVAWNWAAGGGDVAARDALRLQARLFDPDEPPGTAGDVPPDERADGPAMQQYDWADEYFAELASVGSAYWPFTMYRPRDFRGEHVNIDDWERRSYESAAASDGSVPTVAFFGGSALFGEGQRDGHTIPSEVARLAEAEGVPIRARNFGQRGWVLWQEMTLYEQLLAAGEQVDLSVFYDGANDLTVQTQPNSGVPTHYDVEQYARRLAGVEGGAGELGGRDVGTQVRRWWERRSLLYRWGAWLADEASPAAGAAEGPDPDDVPGYEERGTDVYLRTRALTRHLSETHGVQDSYYWQPQAQDLEEYRWAAEEVGPTTVDLSRSLDGRPEVFLDFVHTNEVGARLVAAAMWETLGPRIHEWYRQHG